MEKPKEVRGKMPYAAPKVLRVRLDPEGALMACNKLPANSGCQPNKKNT